MDGQHQRGCITGPVEFIEQGRKNDGEGIPRSVSERIGNNSDGDNKPTVKDKPRSFHLAIPNSTGQLVRVEDVVRNPLEFLSGCIAMIRLKPVFPEPIIKFVNMIMHNMHPLILASMNLGLHIISFLTTLPKLFASGMNWCYQWKGFPSYCCFLVMFG